MYVLKIHIKTAIDMTAVTRCFCTPRNWVQTGRGEPAPCTITWSCVFLDHNLKLSPNRALHKWCFPKVATLRWRLLLRPRDANRCTMGRKRNQGFAGGALIGPKTALLTSQFTQLLYILRSMLNLLLVDIYLRNHFVKQFA